MYLSHFALKELPFSITPDTQFVFAGNGHQEALNTLLIAIKNGEGFVKITGEVGTGKTLLCRRFLSSLNGKYTTAYLPNPSVEPRTLLLAVAEELGLKLDLYDHQFHLLKGINKALLDQARQGTPVVLCIDEAQSIPLESLETLRLLSNLETEKRKLLHIVLFGQPELDTKLSDNSVRQLSQRIAFNCQLKGIRRDELELYLNHRLRVAGHRGNKLFNDGAIKLIHRASKGTPRVINILAHKGLLSAFGEGKHYVDAYHLRKAVKDTEDAQLPWWKLWVPV